MSDGKVGRNKPPIHSQFQKGVSGNPDGSRRHNKELMAIKKLTAHEVQEIGSLILNGNLTELKAIAGDSTASVLKVWIASVAVKSINKGDGIMLNAILDRIVGKIKERVELTGANGGPLEAYLSMSMEERDKAFKRLEERLSSEIEKEPIE